MIRWSSVAFLLLGCGIAAVLSFTATPVRTQEPVMYVQPDTGSVHDTLTFFGWNFAPSTELHVSFTAPDGGILPYANSPITTESDGYFIFEIVPSHDLGTLFGRDGAIQTGRWIMSLVLDESTYYQLEFHVLE
jgi:hypothetical protein